MPKPGYYAVRKGKKTGVFKSWDACEPLVIGYPGAVYKKFKTLAEAQHYLGPSSSEKDQDTDTGNKRSFDDFQQSSNVVESSSASTTHNAMQNGRNEAVIYAVRRGFSTGLFYSWRQCMLQTNGYPNALFGKFESLTEAQAFLTQPLSPSKPTSTLDEEDSAPPPPPSKEPITLSVEQYKGLKRILAGHNVFLSGSAGTGKSFLVQILREVYQSKGKIKQLAITASTGCAACGINGQTIHAWAGVGTGLGSNLTAAELSVKLGKHNRDNWKGTKLLLIDEISMISAAEFEKLSDLAGMVLQRPHLPFGGLQIVLIGDFLQLPPVSKHAPASFCFESTLWKEKLFPDYLHENMIILTKIQRQKEKKFQRILDSIRLGIVTPEVDWFLRQKSVPQIPLMKTYKSNCCEGVTSKASPWFTDQHRRGASSKCVKLYSRVADVTRVNALYLNSLISKERIIIKAHDTVAPKEYTFDPETSRLHRLDHEVPAVKSLELKIGAQVMLIANLNTTLGLVNGARGRVVSFVVSHDTEIGEVVLPVVRFTIESSTHSSAQLENNYREAVSSTRLSADNRGYNIFASMGYSAWNGLGKHEQGSPDPIASPLVNQCSMGLSSRNVNATIERTLEFYEFHLKNSNEKVLATRRQVPLILAHAITIHKTQGMSIPDVEVNMEGIFTSGQAYVALSRAQSAEGLKITGYNNKLVFPNATAVRFYNDIIRENTGGDKSIQKGCFSPSQGRAVMTTSAAVVTSVYELCNTCHANDLI